MAGLYHDFIAVTETEINEYVNSSQISINEFQKNKPCVHIHDDFIQIMLNKRYLISVPCYDYKNKEQVSGLCSIGCTVFHVNQLNLFYEKIDLFEKEIDIIPEIKKEMIMFNRKKEEVLKTVNTLKNFILLAQKNNLCIYHFGI